MGGCVRAACPITEDGQWRGLQEAAGRVHQDAVAPEQRHGVLWDWYGRLKAQGWVLDANGYTTNFRRVTGRKRTRCWATSIQRLGPLRHAGPHSKRPRQEAGAQPEVEVTFSRCRLSQGARRQGRQDAGGAAPSHHAGASRAGLRLQPCVQR